MRRAARVLCAEKRVTSQLSEAASSGAVFEEVSRFAGGAIARRPHPLPSLGTSSPALAGDAARLSVLGGDAHAHP